jgi:hypothetical protein
VAGNKQARAGREISFHAHISGLLACAANI